MNNGTSRVARVARLIAQDREIGAVRSEEFHMKLEASLTKWERLGQLVRRAAWVTGGIAVLCMLAVLPIQASPQLRESRAVALAVCLVGFGSFAVTGVLLMLYRERYAPAATRARFDVQAALVRELQQQVESLQQAARRRE
jgi:hypothetical protein